MTDHLPIGQLPGRAVNALTAGLQQVDPMIGPDELTGQSETGRAGSYDAEIGIDDLTCIDGCRIDDHLLSLAPVPYGSQMEFVAQCRDNVGWEQGLKGDSR